jgi:hypothetical protein
MHSLPRLIVSASLMTLALAATGSLASGQRGGGGFGGGGGGRSGTCVFQLDDDSYFIHPEFRGNPTYDGRVTFARIKYQGIYECGGQGPGWSHDYPRAESHFVSIMRSISSVNPFIRKGQIAGSALVRLDQPEIFNYPVAYLSEPGGWSLSVNELKGLKQYISRGGFIIFDDIEGEPNDDYRNIIFQWRRAFPEAVPIKLTNNHAIFRCFFTIDLSKIPSKVGRYAPEYLAFFEDNDPNKRMLAVIDNYADVGELIEFSDRGLNPVPATEGYKLWVNYFMYAVTH